MRVLMTPARLTERVQALAATGRTRAGDIAFVDSRLTMKGGGLSGRNVTMRNTATGGTRPAHDAGFVGDVTTSIAGGGAGKRSCGGVFTNGKSIALGWFARHGALVLVVPAMLPPPTPFKAFVVLAGVAGVTPRRFLAAVAVGRGLRYTGEAWLARTYGPDAMDFAQANAARVLPGALAVVAVAITVAV